MLAMAMQCFTRRGLDQRLDVVARAALVRLRAVVFASQARIKCKWADLGRILARDALLEGWSMLVAPLLT
jgi:hypothetical protein